MGSITGVILAALILILLPEYLRPLSEYRMLAFGAILVAMMVFKPEGLIAGRRRVYRSRH
jgi:branched-chain amino acid transport system permease protein